MNVLINNKYGVNNKISKELYGLNPMESAIAF
jgi:hypothetical protein